MELETRFPRIQLDQILKSDSQQFDSGSYCVKVMQSAESRQRDDLASARDCRRRNSTSGRVLSQSEMSPVFVVIADVFVQQSSQVRLVQNDHMVEQVPTYTPNPSLSNAVLPRTRKAVRRGSAP